MEPLPLTGERTVPDIAEENYWLRRHEAVYQWLAPLAADRSVLEVGCGEGYGTALLAASARSVLGLDYDATTVCHAARRYPRPRFVRANAVALPVRAGSADVVVALQVIEHLWGPDEFLRECRRVLAPAGLVAVSTPNRLTFSPGLDAPVNPFHVREFTAAELCGVVSRCGFDVEDVLGVRPGPRLRAWEARFGSLVDAQLAGPPPGWGPGLRQAVVGVTVDDFVVERALVHDPDEALDLVVLARRPL